MTPEERVQRYLSKHSCKPLEFGGVHYSPWGWNGGDKSLPTPKNVKDVSKMVEFVLRTSKNFNSLYSETKRKQCECSRSRSALDIWRHILYYNKEITIFDVMRDLYNSSDNSRQYCTVVKKRVFDYENDVDDVYLGDDYETDEFGLLFDEWDNIGK